MHICSMFLCVTSLTTANFEKESNKIYILALVVFFILSVKARIFYEYVTKLVPICPINTTHAKI